MRYLWGCLSDFFIISGARLNGRALGRERCRFDWLRARVCTFRLQIRRRHCCLQGDCGAGPRSLQDDGAAGERDKRLVNICRVFSPSPRRISLVSLFLSLPFFGASDEGVASLAARIMPSAGRPASARFSANTQLAGRRARVSGYCGPRSTRVAAAAANQPHLIWSLFQTCLRPFFDSARLGVVLSPAARNWPLELRAGQWSRVSFALSEGKNERSQLASFNSRPAATTPGRQQQQQQRQQQTSLGARRAQCNAISEQVLA